MSSNIYSLKELGQASTSMKITQNHKKKMQGRILLFQGTLWSSKLFKLWVVLLFGLLNNINFIILLP